MIMTQSTREWEVTRLELIKYRRYLSQFSESFYFISFNYKPRSKNQLADALTTLSRMLKIIKETDLGLNIIETRYEHAYCHNVEAEPDSKSWFYDIKMFLADDSYQIRLIQHIREY